MIPRKEKKNERNDTKKGKKSRKRNNTKKGMERKKTAKEIKPRKETKLDGYHDSPCTRPFPVHRLGLHHMLLCYDPGWLCKVNFHVCLCILSAGYLHLVIKEYPCLLRVEEVPGGMYETDTCPPWRPGTNLVSIVAFKRTRSFLWHAPTPRSSPPPPASPLHDPPIHARGEISKHAIPWGDTAERTVTLGRWLSGGTSVSLSHSDVTCIPEGFNSVALGSRRG